MPTFLDPVLPTAAGLALGSPSQPWTAYLTNPWGPPGPQGPIGPPGPTGPPGGGLLYGKGLIGPTAGTGLAVKVDSYLVPANTVGPIGGLRFRARAYNGDPNGTSGGGSCYLTVRNLAAGWSGPTIVTTQSNLIEMALKVELYNTGVLNKQFVLIDALENANYWLGNPGTGIAAVSTAIDFSVAQTFEVDLQQTTGYQSYLIGWTVEHV